MIMKSKDWIKLFFISSAISVILVGLINYIIDPFQIYRKLTLYPFWYGGIKQERFHIAGLAKNYKYDSIVIGNSMTENFLISDVNKLVPNSIKFCMLGARAYEIYIVLNYAYRYKKIKNVILGLDIYGLTGDVKKIRSSIEFPFFLYDNNIFNDVKYLFSLDVLQESFDTIKKKHSHTKDKILYQYEYMYEWQYLVKKKISNKQIIDTWHNRLSPYNKKDWSFVKMKKSFSYNILSIIKKHPETKFYIFYPPYSFLVYKEWKEQGVLKDVLMLKKYIFDSLNSYNNVELYDFQVTKNIVFNLNNYKDSQHFYHSISSWIIKQMINKKYKVTKDNINSYINTLKEEFNESDKIIKG